MKKSGLPWEHKEQRAMWGEGEAGLMYHLITVFHVCKISYVSGFQPILFWNMSKKYIFYYTHKFVLVAKFSFKNTYSYYI